MTFYRAVLSLIPVLEKNHELEVQLRSLIKGETPTSPKDFVKQKAEKAAKYGQ